MFLILHQFNDDSEPVFSKSNMQALVVSRIGVDVFSARIQRLKDSKSFMAIPEIYNDSIVLDTKGLPEIYFDSIFVEFLKSQNGM